MKRSKLILGTFLLMLFICPMIFISSYASPGIVEQPNMNKDFSIAEEWYNSSWHYRKQISIDGGAVATETDYQVLVNVTYDSDMNTTFADIIFVDDNQITLLDHWLENYTASTFAVFWVEVADAISKGIEHDGELTYIYMYYGNDEASTTSNGTTTFLFFEDWSSETVDAGRWDILTSAGSVAFSAVDANHGSVIQVQADAGTSTYHIETNTNYSDAPYALMMRSYVEKTVAASQSIRCGIGNLGAGGNRYYIDTTAGTQTLISIDDDVDVLTETISDDYFDTWQRFEIQLLETGISLYADFVHVDDVVHDNVATAPYAAMFVRDSEYDQYNDWFASRKFVADEPEVDSWGEEETNIPIEWHESGEAELIFVVPIDETGLNILLIFLGLFMIPASTLYLVKGGKDEASMDKLFFGLIAFVIGWALFLGGIFG